jgi:hypothetical protein
MKQTIIILLLGCSLTIQANDSIRRSSISFKGGYAYPDGMYFSTSYNYDINRWLRISPTFAYANTLLRHEIFFGANQLGIYGAPTYCFSRISSALLLTAHISSRLFTTSDCKHQVSFGVGVGALNMVLIRTSYAWTDQTPPYLSAASATVHSLCFAQHFSLSYGYRVNRRLELGVFGDALLYPADVSTGLGVFTSVYF